MGLNPYKLLAHYKLAVLLTVAALLLTGCGLVNRDTALNPAPSNEIINETEIRPTPVAIATPDGEPLAEHAILVGALLATEGFLSTYDAPALVAIQNRIGTLNEDGGLLGRPVILRHVETHTELSIMKNGAEQLLIDEPDLVLMTCDAVYAEPALKTLQNSQTLVISPCGTDDAWTTGELGERVFSLGTPVSTEADMLAKLVIERGLDTAVVVIDQTSAETVAICDRFQETFAERGGKTLDLLRYQPTDPGLVVPIVNGINVTNPDAIVFCGTRLVAPEVLGPIRQAGNTQPIFASSSMDGDFWIGRVPNIGDFTMLSYGSVYTDSADPSPQVQNVLQDYFMTTKHRASDGRLITGHDAMEAYIRAVTRAGTTQPEAVTAELKQFNQEGFVAGPVTFSSGRHAPVNRPMRVIVVEEPYARFHKIIEIAPSSTSAAATPTLTNTELSNLSNENTE